MVRGQRITTFQAAVPDVLGKVRDIGHERPDSCGEEEQRRQPAVNGIGLSAVDYPRRNSQEVKEAPTYCVPLPVSCLSVVRVSSLHSGHSTTAAQRPSSDNGTTLAHEGSPPFERMVLARWRIERCHCLADCWLPETERGPAGEAA